MEIKDVVGNRDGEFIVIFHEKDSLDGFSCYIQDLYGDFREKPQERKGPEYAEVRDRKTVIYRIGDPQIDVSVTTEYEQSSIGVIINPHDDGDFFDFLRKKIKPK